MSSWLKSAGERWLANLALFFGVILAVGGFFTIVFLSFASPGFVIALPLAFYVATLYVLPLTLVGLLISEILAAVRVPVHVIRWIGIGIGMLIAFALPAKADTELAVLIGLGAIAFAAFMRLPGPQTD